MNRIKTFRKKSRFVTLCALLVAGCLSLAACGGGVDLTPQPPPRLGVESIQILNEETVLKPGEYVLSAKVKPANVDQGVRYFLQSPVEGVGITDNKLTVGMTAVDKADVTVLVQSTYDSKVASRITFKTDVPVIEGTPIYTAEELRAIDKDDESRKGSYILMNDIDLAPEGYQEGDVWDTENDWEPIGLGEIQSDGNDQVIRPANPFNGIINGNGYTVKNMHITRTNKKIEGNHQPLWERQILGFIGQLGAGAELKNIKIQGEINGGSWCGGLLGVNGGGKVSNCISDVNLVTGKSAGALVNNNREGSVKNCIAIGKTTTTQSPNSDKHSAGLFVSQGDTANCFGDKDTMNTPNVATLNAPPTVDKNVMISTEKMQQRKTFAAFDEDIWNLRDGHYPELKNAENGGGPVEAYVGFDMEQTAFNVKKDSEAQLVVSVSGTKDTRVRFGLEGNPVGVRLNEETGVLSFTQEAQDFTSITVTATLVKDTTKTARRTFKIQNDDYDTNGRRIEIGSEVQLYRLIDEKDRFHNANVTLTSDIQLTTFAQWPGIGNDDAPFTGTFNGKGHKISGINGTSPLFGVIKSPNAGTIAVQNLSVEGTVNKNGATWMGGLVNKLKRGTISDCIVDVDVTADYGLGGIAGLNSEEGSTNQSVIQHCIFVGTLNANEDATFAEAAWVNSVHPRSGGITGANNATVKNSYYDSAQVKAVPSGDTSANYDVSFKMNSTDKTGAKTTAQLQSDTALTDLLLFNWHKDANKYPVPTKDTVPSKPLPIVTEADLLAISNNPGADYELKNDIVLTKANWPGLCSEASPYTGNFDGKGHTISGFTATGKGYGYGFFIRIANGAVIKNVALTGSIGGGSWGGALVGTMSGNVTVQDCLTNVTISKGDNRMGGIIGSYPEEITTGRTTLTRCIALGNITNKTNAGAFTSSDVQISATDCFALTGIANNFCGAGTPTWSSCGFKSDAELKAGTAFANFSPSIWKFEAGKLPTLIPQN